MMDQDRNLGVTEGRFGLTLLICLLVAVGYVALLKLGGTGDSAVEKRVEGVTPPARVEAAPNNDDQPQVLETAKLPSRPSVQRSDAPPAPPEYPVLPNNPVDSGDPQLR